MYDMPLKTGVFAAVFSSLFFYIWTNFGVWCLSHGMWYTFDIDGLVKCYVAGLSFLRNMFLGNLILCPMVITCCSKLLKYEDSEKLSIFYPLSSIVAGTVSQRV